MTLPPLTYGVWVRGQGWLKAVNFKSGRNEACAFFSVKVAARTAKRVGGRVEYIDDSLVALEANLLDIEKRNSIKWRLNVLYNLIKAKKP